MTLSAATRTNRDRFLMALANALLLTKKRQQLAIVIDLKEPSEAHSPFAPSLRPRSIASSDDVQQTRGCE